GRLRPQILDRFGLRVNVRGLVSKADRLEVYQRVRAYRQSPTRFIREWEEATASTREDIVLARELLRETTIADEALELGLTLVQDLDIDSHRAEYTMFEAARAHAAADGRDVASTVDVRAVAPMALRQRRSPFMVNFFESQHEEDEQIRSRIDQLMGSPS
ncbi:MAG: magnesium chelatase, partial [Anaerolineae bacterium]|nr:magnesium chelatase [Anaerolineae bacterium]